MTSAPKTFAIVAAALLLGGVQAAAQTMTNPEKKTVTAKPAPKPKPAAAKLSDQTRDDNYWTTSTDLGKYSRETPAERNITSRVPLNNAAGSSVGFASESIKAGTLADGRVVPGMERYNQNPQSYVGMSLSVTSSDKSFPLLATPTLPRNSSW